MRVISIVLAAFFALTSAAAAQTPTIRDFARDPAVTGASLSPSGRYVAAIDHQPDGDRLVIIDWAEGANTPIAQTVRGRQITDIYVNWVSWKTDDRLIYSITAVDVRPDVPFEMRRSLTRVQSINRSGGDIREMLRQREHGWVVLADILPADPNHVLIRAPEQGSSGLWRANVLTGAAERVESPSRYVGNWYMNRDGVPVFRLEFPRSGGGYRLARRAPGTNAWRDVTEVLAENFDNNREFFPVGAGPRPEQMYVTARPEGANFGAVYLYDVATGELGEPVVQVENSDIFTMIAAPGTREIILVCTYDRTQTCRGQTPEISADWRAVLAPLRQYGDVSLIDISDDGQTWLIRVEGPTNPGFYAVYSREQARLQLVNSVRPDLRDRLLPTEAVSYQTRDGVTLWGYLTRPASVSGPAPLVVMPHGGPESRDYANYDFVVQFLASRGYTVFQPQFRGSEGFGRAFAAEGYGQWGARMQDDVTDSVRHLISSGVADAQRVCIFGISYGGYAALTGAALTPDLYRCAVGVAGVYDLAFLARQERIQSGSRSLSMAYLRRTLGSDDRQALQRVSPTRLAANINIPVLLIHGDQDWVAEVDHSQRMRDALEDAGKTVRYVEIANVAHPFSLWHEGERAQLLTELETFFAAHLAAAPAN
jgi:dipeptidyl aminopeptidase/acylaminoacyl peptidase